MVEGFDSDNSFITYCELHCTTERALFHKKHFMALVQLAGETCSGLLTPDWASYGPEVIKPLVKAARASRGLKCPLCKSELNYVKATTDNSGGYYRAYAYCDCGFKFCPSHRYDVKVGESGWEAISRDIAEKERLIYSTLGV